MKTVLITGGNNGIGKATAIGLAKKGFEVIIACRNETKGETAVLEIKKASKNDKISLLICDLASLKSVEKCAVDFKSKYDKLDVLVNNAGLIVGDYKTTEEGFEYQFGVNHMGHFYLTKLLLSTILASAAPRIVTVSSAIHYQGKFDFETLRTAPEKYSSMDYYAQSKLANILFTKGLAKRYPKIIANTLHPGVVGTGFGSGDVAWYIKGVWNLMKPFLINPEKGAATSIYLASSEEVNVSGKYFDKKQEKRSSKLSDDAELAEQLWEYSEKVIEEYT
jgi:NAD(P)-dependent dehydrogenase (short-subunit alcohol dehydrogenase family)